MGGPNRTQEGLRSYNRMLKTYAGRRFMYGYPLPYAIFPKTGPVKGRTYKFHLTRNEANRAFQEYHNNLKKKYVVRQITPAEFTSFLYRTGNATPLNRALIAEVRRELELEGSLKPRRTPSTPRTVGRVPLRSTLPLHPGPSLKYLSYTALKKQLGVKTNKELARTLGPALRVNMNQLKMTKEMEKARQNAERKALQNAAARRIQTAWRRR